MMNTSILLLVWVIYISFSCVFTADQGSRWEPTCTRSTSHPRIHRVCRAATANHCQICAWQWRFLPRGSQYTSASKFQISSVWLNPSRIEPFQSQEAYGIQLIPREWFPNKVRPMSLNQPPYQLKMRSEHHPSCTLFFRSFYHIERHSKLRCFLIFLVIKTISKCIHENDVACSIR